MTFFRKLNFLVPDPQCKTVDNAIVEWSDTRARPTDDEINAIDMADVEAKEAEDLEEKMEIPDVHVVIAKGLLDHENRIRALEGKKPVKLKQLIKAIRKL